MNFEISTMVCILAWLLVWTLAVACLLMPSKLWAKLVNKCKSFVMHLPLVGSKRFRA